MCGIKKTDLTMLGLNEEEFDLVLVIDEMVKEGKTVTWEAIGAKTKKSLTELSFLLNDLVEKGYAVRSSFDPIQDYTYTLDYGRLGSIDWDKLSDCCLRMTERIASTDKSDDIEIVAIADDIVAINTTLVAFRGGG